MNKDKECVFLSACKYQGVKKCPLKCKHFTHKEVVKPKKTEV
jgi:hypothetical protein